MRPSSVINTGAGWLAPPREILQTPVPRYEFFVLSSPLSAFVVASLPSPPSAALAAAPRQFRIVDRERAADGPPDKLPRFVNAEVPELHVLPNFL